MKIKGKTILVWAVFFLAFIFYIRVFATINQDLSFTDDKDDPNEQQSLDSDTNDADHFTFMDDFMKDKNLTYCHKCHDPKIEDYGQVRGITASCTRGSDGIGTIECHSLNEHDPDNPRALGRTHPVVDTLSLEDLREVPDDMKEIMPDDFHLEEGKYLTCTTCHNPRKDAFSDKPMVGGDEKIEGPDKYRSYFLRQTNIDSNLCHQCHTDK